MGVVDGLFVGETDGSFEGVSDGNFDIVGLFEGDADGDAVGQSLQADGQLAATFDHLVHNETSLLT